MNPTLAMWLLTIVAVNSLPDGARTGLASLIARLDLAADDPAYLTVPAFVDAFLALLGARNDVALARALGMDVPQ